LDINTVEHTRASLNSLLELIIAVAERMCLYMSRFEKMVVSTTGTYIEDGVLSLPALVKPGHRPRWLLRRNLLNQVLL
jgi:hypothetical protein